MISKKEWLLIIGSVFVVWFIDFSTKQWAVSNIRSLQFYGPFGLVLHRNPGAMLGIFSDLPAVLRIVTLSTGGAFLIFVYSAIQYLIPQKLMVLRCGMSILLGGILGNVTDRIIWGSVVDFLLLGSRSFASPAFNFADAIQWVGYAMVVYSLLKHGSDFWPENNTRKKMWVNFKYQIKYISILIAIGTGFAIITGVFSYTYLKVTIEDLVVGRSQLIETKFLVPFLITHVAISLAFAIILFIVGKILSHRTAGPIYAFEQYIDDLLHGKERDFKLRAGDDFPHLVELANGFRDKLSGLYTRNEQASESSETRQDRGTRDPAGNQEKTSAQEDLTDKSSNLKSG